MFFTQEDYRKIEKWLLANSRKDTDFVGAATPLKGNETVVLVQDGKNVKTSVKDIVDQFFLLGVSDFLNITDKYGESYISLTQAIQLIPFRSRKIGQVITFIDESGNWAIYQFQGNALNQWNNTTLWIDLLAKISGIPIIDSEDIITKVDDANQVSLYLADKQYNEADYSGLGRIYLRKNIQSIIDPSTGAVINVNLLTQSMLAKENTIYIIQYDYNLNNQTITIPEGCILDMRGGSVTNGTVNCVDTIIISTDASKLDVTLTGTYRFDSEKLVTSNTEDINIIQSVDRKSHTISAMLADRDTTNGMGYVILRKDKSFKEQVTQENTIYEIRYDFDLNGAEITIPEGCVLDFQGGMISNGSIVFSNTLNAGEINFSTCRFYGSVKNKILHVDDYGADNSNNVDNAVLFNDLIALNVGVNKSKTIQLGVGVYKITAPIVLGTTYQTPVYFIGVGNRSVINQHANNDYIFKVYEVQHIKDLTIKYNEFQPVENTKSIAIASKRALFSTFLNLEMYNFHTGFGFIKNGDQDFDYGDTAALVNCRYDNIRILTYSGYVFDTITRISGGDSGSIINNIHISNNATDVIPQGCFYIGSSIFTINQLNIELSTGAANPFIYCTPYSKLVIGYLHFEWCKHQKAYISVRDFSGVIIESCDFESCSFDINYMTLFQVVNNSYLRIGGISVKDNCSGEASNIGLFTLDKTSTIEYDYFKNRYVRNIVPVFNLAGVINNKLSFDYSYNVVARRDDIADYSYIYGQETNNVYIKNATTLRCVKTDRALDDNNVLIKNEGTFDEKPTITAGGVVSYFDTTSNRMLYWKGTWRDALGVVANLNKYGATENRPIISSGSNIGFQYFDTTLGKYICWSGTAWINLDGTSLS